MIVSVALFLFFIEAFLIHVAPLQSHWFVNAQCRSEAPKITSMIVIVEFALSPHQKWIVPSGILETL